MKPNRENGYQVTESMVDTGKSSLLRLAALLHLAEGSAQTVSNSGAEKAAGAQILAAISPQTYRQGVAEWD